MTDTARLRILHLVSAPQHGGASQAAAVPLSTLLSRVDSTAFAMQVVYFNVGNMQAAVCRQLGVPVHEIELSRRRFSPAALKQLYELVQRFDPDVLHAWGHTAQLATLALRGRKSPRPVVWSMPNTPPLTERSGLIDRQKIKLLRKYSPTVQRLVYPSSGLAAQYRRLGFSESNEAQIAPGIDVDRFKPDMDARLKMREQLKLEANDFVIGMHAPFTVEADFATFIKATADLIKFHPNVQVLLSGKAVQRGNASLMALLGGGTLATRTTLLGERSDLSNVFNACDVMCSSALNDSSALTMAGAMLCGVPCVGTGKGAQGEVLGKFGVVIEPGSPNGLARGITRIIEMPADRRTYMARLARQHALDNYSVSGFAQQHVGLYLELIHQQETQPRPAPVASRRAAVAK